MRFRVSVPWLALFCLTPVVAGAQFATSQVSPPGAPPFLMSKSEASHEDLSDRYPDVSYNVYRRQPTDDFRCIDSGRLDPTAWNGDPESPQSPGEVWWYAVTADDSWGENLHGSPIAISERCPCSGLPPVTGNPDLGLELVADGFSAPVHLTAPPGDRTRLFVVERPGSIRILKRGSLLAEPFLDIRSKVLTGGGNSEQGLLSLAFHPDYETNGRFFVDYTADPSGQTVVEEYRVSADPDLADEASGSVILTQSQPFANHNGGQVAFGPDGFLYISFGDGGSGNDPLGAGQDLSTWLGTILRIDVDSATPYAVPPDNPFALDGDPDTLGEIWSWGLRNPWRFSFDRANGDLYIADVGQRCIEEVSVEPAGSKGLNHGWNTLEGTTCFVAGQGCGQVEECGVCPQVSDCSPFHMPVVQFSHAEGCSITGGHVYRGCRLPDYRGAFFFADFCSNIVRSFVYSGGQATEERDWTSFMPEVSGPSSFGEDARGELYVLNLGGSIYRIVPQ